MGSYYDSEPSTPTLHIEEEDDIDARLAALDQKLMVHSLRIMTLENAKRNEERMEKVSQSISLNPPTWVTGANPIYLMNRWIT